MSILLLLQAAPTTARPAGAARRRGVAIESRGRLHLFETDEEARAWLDEQEPKQEKVIRKIAKRIARKVIAQAMQDDAPAVIFIAPKVEEGAEELKALVNMRAALLNTRLNAEVQRQIQRELEADEEAAAVIVLTRARMYPPFRIDNDEEAAAVMLLM